MDDVGTQAFISLFKEACLKCFGHALQQPLTETESRLFYNNVLEQTGLVIGWKSLKNYSFFVLNEKTARQENPSTASLDTLARYVLAAPFTTETERKTKGNHYPYWFQYKEQLYAHEKIPLQKKTTFKPGYFSMALFLIIVLLLIFFIQKNKPENFTENFHSVMDDTLHSHGWFVQSKDTIYWKRRNENGNMLSLFTLQGDNWPDTVHASVIKNLLLRKIDANCFTAEVHLRDFFPKKEWQQAGIILLEDTNFTGKSLRLSIAYNDFFGGYAKPDEIIIQAITSPGNGLSKPEEIVHVPVFTLDSGKEALVHNNLAYSGLRIEKNKNNFRLLYSCSPTENFAFKEAATTRLTFQPKYIGIFALKGFVNDTGFIPASFNFFSVAHNSCKD